VICVIITKKLSVTFSGNVQKTEILWHNLTKFLQTKNITLEIKRLEALVRITNGTVILRIINNIKNRFIYLIKLNKRNLSFAVFLNYMKIK